MSKSNTLLITVLSVLIVAQVGYSDDWEKVLDGGVPSIRVLTTSPTFWYEYQDNSFLAPDTPPLMLKSDGYGISITSLNSPDSTRIEFMTCKNELYIVTYVWNIQYDAQDRVTGYSEYRDFPGYLDIRHAITISNTTYDGDSVVDFDATVVAGQCPPYIHGIFSNSTWGDGQDNIDPLMNFTELNTDDTMDLDIYMTGFYLKQVPRGWSGSVTPVNSEWEDAYYFPSTRTYNNVQTSQMNEHFFWNDEPFVPLTISGEVRNDEGVAMADVILAITWPDVSISVTAQNAYLADVIKSISGTKGLQDILVTDQNGYYAVNTFEGWSGSVTPVWPGRLYIPESKSYSNLESEMTGENFIASNAPFSVSGVVTDKYTTLPLEGVRVGSWHDAEEVWRETWTNEFGEYEITGLEPGEIDVSALPDSSMPYAAIGAEFQLTADVADLDFALPAGATLSGKVIDIRTARPVDGVRVTYYSERYDVSLKTDTDPQGRFTLTNLPPGLGEVMGRPETSTGYAWSLPWGENWVYIEEGEHVTNRIISLRSGAQVTGHIEDADGIALGYTWFEYEGRFSEGWADTDDKGDFSIRLPQGTFAISLDMDDGLASKPRIVTVDDLTQVYDVGTIVGYSQATGGWISGTVDNTGGYPKTDAFVVVAFEAGTDLSVDTIHYIWPVSVTDLENAGEYTVDALPDGSYDIYLVVVNETRDDVFFATVRDEVLDVPLGTENVDLDYSSAGGTIVGKVKSVDGRLVIGSHLILSNSTTHAFAGFADVDASGGYALYNVPAGQYTLTATHSMYQNASTTVQVVEGESAHAGVIIMPFAGEKEGADLNGDGLIDTGDLLAFAGQWLQDGMLDANFDRQGNVDLSDFVRLAGLWQWEAIWLNSAQTWVSVGRQVYSSDEPIVVDFHNASGDVMDWIGLYEAGADNRAIIDWFYSDGTKRGAAGIIDGSLTFTTGLPDPGQYEVRLFFDNSYNIEAAAQFTVAAVGPSVAVDKTTYSPEEAIVVNFQNASANAWDWIGLYETGAANDKFMYWLRSDGTKAGTAGIVEGSVTFPDGLPDTGQYEARLFFNNSFNLEATTAFNIE